MPVSSWKSEGFFEFSAEAERALISKASVRPKGNFEVPQGSVAVSERGAFTARGFAVKKGNGKIPFATVASNGHLGFAATENSLGFSFYENAALGKLTPHTADNMREDRGERLLLRIHSRGAAEFCDHDLCASSHTAEFYGNGARYRGEIDGVEYTVDVCMDKEKPIKKLSVVFSSGMEKTAELFYAVLPCLGERSEKAGRYTYEHTGGVLYVSSVFENNISLALWAKGATAVTNEAELLSGGRVCGGGDIAALGVKAQKGELVFYLAAISADFKREDFEAFLSDNAFCAAEPIPIFESVSIKTGNALFDLSVNVLFPYQTYYSRFVGRTGFYQVGGAYGFRDQLQDSLSFLENAPELCREQIIRAAAHQYREGDVAHWWQGNGLALALFR